MSSSKNEKNNDLLLSPQDLLSIRSQVAILTKRTDKLARARSKINDLYNTDKSVLDKLNKKIFLHEQETKYQGLDISIFSLLEIYDKDGRENPFFVKKLKDILAQYDLDHSGYFTKTEQRVLHISLDYYSFDSINKAFKGIQFFLPYIKPVIHADFPSSLVSFRIRDNDLSESGTLYLCFNPETTMWGIFKQRFSRFTEIDVRLFPQEKTGLPGLFNILKIISKNYFYESPDEKLFARRAKQFRIIEDSIADYRDIEKALAAAHPSSIPSSKNKI